MILYKLYSITYTLSILYNYISQVNCFKLTPFLAIGTAAEDSPERNGQTIFSTEYVPKRERYSKSGT